MAPALDWKFLGAMLTAFLGIPIYAFIAVALGVFGSNPLEQHQNQKVKPAYVYLYMTLAGLYVYAIVTPYPAQRLIFMVLSLLLAFALWQKARDQLPYLLDPDASPPPRVSTSDGLIAAMLFFVAQGIAAAVIIGRGRVTGAALLIAFSHRWRHHLCTDALRCTPGRKPKECRTSSRGIEPAAARHRRRARRRGLRPRLSIRHRLSRTARDVARD